LYGCFLRRLLQKEVSWENCSLIPLKYNEEIASITLFPSLKTPSEDISAEGRIITDPRVCESLLQEGDTGFILTRSGHRLDIVVASHLRGVAKSYEEFLHFKGVMNTASLRESVRKAPTDLLHKDEVFSLLEFVFIPLRPQSEPVSKHRGKPVMWKQFNTLNSQIRPFNVGIFGSDTESRNSPWHHIQDPLQSEEDELGAASSLAYYAS